jgi:hypothetical protein
MSELDLIHLTVTPKQARMLATSAMERSYHYLENYGDDNKNFTENQDIGKEYRELSALVDKQRQL